MLLLGGRSFESRAGILKGKMDVLPLQIDNDLLLKDPHQLMGVLKTLTAMKNEIGKTLPEVQDILSVMESYKHDPLPIEENLKRIEESYQALQDDYQKFFKEKGRLIISRFREVVDSLSPQGIEVKDEVRKQLFENWKTLQGAFPADSRHEGLLEDVKFQIIALDQMIAPEDLIPLQAPLKLRNSGGTSCYIDSVIQAFAGVKVVFEELIKPLTIEFNDEDDKYHKKLMVQNALKEVLSGQPLKQEKHYSLMESLLFFLPKDSPNECLRKAIFKSGLHPEFKQAVIDQQLDAASIAEFLTQQFLPHCRYQLQEYTSLLESPKAVHKTPLNANPPNCLLPIPLAFGDSKEPIAFDDLISSFLDKHVNKGECRRFEPQKKRKVSDSAKVPKLNLKSEEDGDVIEVTEYNQWYRFKMMPSVLMHNSSGSILFNCLI